VAIDEFPAVEMDHSSEWYLSWVEEGGRFWNMEIVRSRGLLASGDRSSSFSAEGEHGPGESVTHRASHE
jgi:hypothetical protein